MCTCQCHFNIVVLAVGGRYTSVTPARRSNSGGGYVGLKNVNADGGGAKDDKMETFWLAETLKYFLLLFSEDSLLDLNTHVLNTEAHPLRVLPQ